MSSDQRAICWDHCVNPSAGCSYIPYIPEWEDFDAPLCEHYENAIYKQIREANTSA